MDPFRIVQPIDRLGQGGVGLQVRPAQGKAENNGRPSGPMREIGFLREFHADSEHQHYAISREAGETTATNRLPMNHRF